MKKNDKKLTKEIEKLKGQVEKDQTLPNYLKLLEKLMEAEDFESALLTVEEAIEKFKNHQTVFVAKAKILFELEEYVQADSIVTEILNSNPDNLVAKRISDEINKITEETNSSADSSETFSINDGFEALENGNTELALTIFKKVLEDDPENSDAKEGFMQAYAASVDTEKDDRDPDIDEVDKRSAVILKTIEILEYWKKANRLKQEKATQVRHDDEQSL